MAQDNEQRAPVRSGGDPELPASETTPLLNGAPKPTTENGAVAAAPEGDEEVAILPVNVSTTRTVVIMTTVYVGVFIGAIDSSIIATLASPIASELHSLSVLSWLATAYLIATAASQPLSGRLTDIFGRGPGLLFCNLMFGLGNLGIGLSQTSGQIIAGRVVAGIGGGGLMSIATFLASDLVPLRKRGLVQGIGNIAWGGGAMVGGVFGGLVNDHTALGWRLAFLIQVPVITISGILVYFLVSIPPKASSRSLLRRIDFVGAFSIVTFLVLLLLGLNAGGNIVPWTHPLVLTTIPLSLVALLAFLYWESRTPQPIIPVRLLLDRTVLAGCLTNFVCSMALFMLVFYVPLYLQVRGWSASAAGACNAVSAVGVSVSSVCTGLIMRKTGRYYRTGIVSMALFVAGTAVALTLDGTSPAWPPFVGYFLVGAGYGGMLTVTLLACIAAVDHSQQAVVTSATYAFRSVGGTVGITVASAVYQNLLREGLWRRFGGEEGAAEEIARIRDDLKELGRLPAGWYPGVMDAFMEAFRGVWIVGVALAVAGLVFISVMRQHTLHDTIERR